MKMEQQLKNWIDFCEGKSDFDKSEFYTLFMEGNGEDGRRSEEELKSIFQFFPNNEELIKRVQNVFLLSERINDPNSFVLNATKKDLTEKLKILSIINETELIESIKKDVCFVSNSQIDEQELLEDEFHHEFVSVIDDYLTDHWISQDNKIYALFEAFYGLAHNYGLVWYLGSPLISTEIDLDNYFDVWQYGGFYALTENQGVIVSRRDSNTEI